jgi:hypothetical protein
LEGAVLRVFGALTLSTSEVDCLREWIADHSLHIAAEREEEMRVARLQLESLRTRRNRLTDLFLDGTVEQTIFGEKQKTLVWEEAQLKHKLVTLEGGDGGALKEIERTVELAKDASLLYKQANPERKRELLRILLSNLTVAGKNVSVELRIPFRLIAQREKTSYGGPYRGTCRTLGKLLDELHNYITIGRLDA